MTTGRILSTLVFTALGVVMGFLIKGWFEQSTRDAADSKQLEKSVESVLAEGKIKPFDGIRLIATLPGRSISRLPVEEGTPIEAGKTKLAVMADEEMLRMQWELAKARKSDALMELEQKILTAKLNRATANATLKSAELNLERLESTSPEASYVDKKIETSQKKLDRLEKLSNDPGTASFVSTQALLDQQLELDKAKAEKQGLKQAAELAVTSATEGLELANELLKRIEDAKSNLKSLELAAAIAKEQYDNSILLAPISGEVVKIHLQAGDVVSNFPLMEVANLDRMCVEAEVFFAGLRDVKVGQSVEISSPALEETLSGTVASKSNYIGGGLLQSPNPLAMTDQETAMVKIAIDPESTEMAKRFLNLQVTVTIEIQ